MNHIDDFSTHGRERKPKIGKGPKGKDLTIFVRYGGLDLKNQEGYGEDTYHAPPSSRGFYAMPQAAQELFLVGSIKTFQPDNFSKKSGDYEDDHKKEKEIKKQIFRKFKKNTGNIWHHLSEYVKNNEIIDRHGSWVKTTIKTWQEAFNKSSLNDRYGKGDKDMKKNSINKARSISGYFSKDHYEVFFDEKV